MTGTTTIAPAVDVASLLRDIKEGRAPADSLPVDLRGAVLVDADLSGLDLSGVDLSGAALVGADLSGARLFRAVLHGANLKRANLDGAELAGADLTGAILEEATARHAGFGNAQLKGARLFAADLTASTFSLADLEEADFRDTRLGGARLREANLTRADFTAADLQGADLSLTCLEGAVFNNADLRDSRLRQVLGFERASWIGVDLRSINFAGAFRLRRHVKDQNYIMEFRQSGRLAAFLYYPWWLTSDCGRSIGRWLTCIALLTALYSWLYTFVGIEFGPNETWLSPVYFSIVTLTTLGYGDAVPVTVTGQAVVITQVVIGYTLLGGLLSIFSNIIARRAD